MNGKLSLIKAREEQDDLWKLIFKMIKRVGKKSLKAEGLVKRVVKRSTV